MSLVLDASAALTWVFKDEATSRSDELFERVASDGATVPPLFAIEFANALVQGERRGRITPDYSAERLEIIGQLHLTVIQTRAQETWTRTLELARAEGLTVYDASYLDLAMRLGEPLATLDTDLAGAANRRGVTLAL